MSAPSPYAQKLAGIPVAEHTVSVGGSIAHYWEYGDPASEITLVLVHGFRGDHHGLEPVVAQLPGYRLISPDLPGFGTSEPLAIPHTLDAYASWLRTFLSLLAVRGPLVVLGHSFGSIVVAAALADTDAPDALRPRSVILVNPIAAPALSGPRGVFTRLAVFYYWLGAVLPERLGFGLLRNRAIVRVMSAAMAKTRDAALRRWIHEEHDRYFSAFADRSVVLDAFKASIGSDVSEFAARIPYPTLLLAADRDDITPVAAQHRLRELFPDARLAVLEGVGHLIHYEMPQQAASAIQNFLEDNR